jgi:GH15 family glucan-1,4-alpha-glucosidase
MTAATGLLERDLATPDVTAKEFQGFLPIAEHGIIGDQRSAALVGTDGTIDWYCPNRFDAPSVFAAILDPDQGGSYRIAPSAPAETKQLYLPDTNVLITRFLCSTGVGEVQDFMPLDGEAQRIVRRVVGVRGAARFRLELMPRFGYARDGHVKTPTSDGVVFAARSGVLSLASPVALELTAGGVRADFEVRAGATYTFVLSTSVSPEPLLEDEADALMRTTAEAWRSWLASSTYAGRWRELVHRSALTLALLTYAATGAIVAAPTTSLPEQLGGERNWDYRFVWPRDFAFAQRALWKLGFTREALMVNRFAYSLAGDAPDPTRVAPLQTIYRVDGRTELQEERLDHLSGYRGSRPVRIGNAAASQLQLDIYGELLDALYLNEQSAFENRGQFVSYDEWQTVRRHVDWLCDHWTEPDEGIWEVRNGRREFTYSRLMSWVAVDRAIRMAINRSLPSDLARWSRERDRIFEWIMRHGWNEQRQSFVQSAGSDVLDASLLLMPLVHFIAPTDPRWLSTLDAIGGELVQDSLVYRYNPMQSADGLDGDEGTFSVCTYWYVQCLARAGRVEEAELVVAKMNTYANHVGLYSEQIGSTGELLGNFPQTFTHLALINAAVDLDRRLTASSRGGLPS